MDTTSYFLPCLSLKNRIGDSSRNDLVSLRLGTKRGFTHPLYNLRETSFLSHFQTCRHSTPSGVVHAFRHKQSMNRCKPRNDLVSLRLGTKRGCLHTLFTTLEKLHSFHTSRHADTARPPASSMPSGTNNQ